MRILQVVASYAPAWGYGGPTRVAYELSQALQRRGHEVTVYTTDAFLPRLQLAASEDTCEEGIRVVRMRNRSCPAAERLRLFSPRGFRQLVRHELSHYDIVHIHEHRMLYNHLLRQGSRRTGVPYVLSPHGTATYNGQRVGAKRLFDFTIGNAVLRHSAMIVALTSGEANDLARLPRIVCPIVTIPNGVRLPPLVSVDDRLRQHRQWGVSDSQKVILYFGRIAHSKGIDALLRALGMSPPVLENAHLVICGPDDDAEADLRRLADQLGLRSRTTFPAPVYSDAKNVVIQSADVLVVPKFTGLPLVLLEAAANGCPAVTGTAGSELPWLDGTGGVTTSLNHIMLRDALTYVLCGKTGVAMGTVARSMVARSYSWDSIAAQYEHQYETILGTRDRGYAEQ